jgi:hypothetical protein
MTESAHFDANARKEAAACANAEDAAVWFSNLYDEGLIRWCRSNRGWLISVSHRHVATTATFDEGIREAMARTQDAGRQRNKNRTRRGEDEPV